MFKKLKELLEAGKITQELASELDSEISVSLKELRDESAGWRVKFNDLNKNFEAISQAKDKLEAKLSGFDEAIQKAKDNGKSELVAELEAQKQETQRLQESFSNIEAQNKALRVETELSSVLGNYDVIDVDVMKTVLKERVLVDGDSIKYKDGENSLSLEDGVKKFFESKPNLLKPKGNAGSGAGNGGNGAQTKSFKEMTATERAELYNRDVDLYNKLKKGD